MSTRRIGPLLVAVAALFLVQCRGNPLARLTGPTPTTDVASSTVGVMTGTAVPATATGRAAPPTDTPPAPSVEASPTPSATATPWRISFQTDAPASLRTLITDALAAAPGRYDVASDGGELVISSRAEGENATLFLARVFVPVMRFATVQDATTTEALRALWQGTATEPRLLVDADTHGALQMLWGAQGDGAPVEVVESSAITDRLWQEPSALAIVPFDRLEPRLAALALDGQRALDNHLAVDAAGVPTDYPLTLRLYVAGPPAGQLPLIDLLLQAMPFTNRDPQRLTTLIMTGVTAMARMTAVRMEQYGDPAYPARVIGDVLAAADITHISNEIPFKADCVPDGSEDSLVFCSHPSYYATFERVGADIVGLTGNHMADFGTEAMLFTLDLYKEKGIPYYAGGANEAEATTPLIITHNGNRIAFLGANQWGPPYTWATADSPGAARYDPDALTAQIRALREGGDVDIIAVEFQWEESYQVLPLASQVEGFRLMAEAGADLVTGVQSHVPQTVEFAGDGGVILYGLGNIFFDQMWSTETRQGLIARQTFHQGRHIGTELLVTILEDYVQPRWATPEERADVLSRVFTGSGW